ncbi:MAG TPA: glycosyltransferase family 1 protein [Candidatus Dormibacteraeota bacterium]|jgi:alpha-1,3-rhamnosyl/mannosyltransferase|nr:glycosyltransferase family 1 protein [Candidatus Dormibacteraeota bacterium]
MRVGLDARFSSARYDGVGRYVAVLLTELLRLQDGPDVVAVYPGAGDPPRHPLPEGDAHLTVLHPRRSVTAESPWAQLELPVAARRHHLDAWHSPFPAVPLLVPAPVVVTSHDCIPERFPAYFRSSRRALYRGGVWTSVKRARVVIVPSQMSADDLARYYRVPPRRIRLVPHGVDLPPASDPVLDAEHRARLGVADGYVLIVGRPRPHKGYAMLVRALARLAPDERPHLVRVGRPDPRLPDGHEEEAHRLGVQLTGLVGISDGELLALYRGASLVAVPSRVEGFGLPLLEALAAGAPVLAAAIQPLEASGGDAARYVEPPDNEEAWAECLQSALRDTAWHQRAALAGPTRAALFPWSASAQATLAVYREAAA